MGRIGKHSMRGGGPMRDANAGFLVPPCATMTGVMAGVAPEILKKIPLFQALDGAALLSLAATARKQAYEPRQVIVDQDDPGGAVFLIESGRVKVSVAGPDGRISTLGDMGPGEIIGEISLLDGGPRSARVEAVTRTEVICIERQPFLSVVERQQGAAITLLAVLASRLRRLTRWADELAGLSVPARLAKRLLSLAAEHGMPTAPGRIRIGLRLSQRELATRVGVTRESINKHMRRFEAQGILEQEKGYLVLLDVERLKSMAAEE